MAYQGSAAGSPVLQPLVPQTLPISSGNSQNKQAINDTNLQIQGLISQSKANTLYDPTPPPYVSNGTGVVQGFCNYDGDIRIYGRFFLACAVVFLGIAILSKK